MIYSKMLAAKAEKRKQISVLIDPDKPTIRELESLAQLAERVKADYFFVGGSLLTNDHLEICIDTLKSNSSIPVVLFPGNNLQISAKADALLFLSLISGRNADMLIGRHVIAAPYLKHSKLEVIPTGYMLIESGKTTSVEYMSNSFPIPSDKNDIAVCTAMAGEMLGMKLIYMDAGSGALNPVQTSMIQGVNNSIRIPVIVGGGIKTPEKAIENCNAGADIIVVGNSFEKHPELLSEMVTAVHSV